MKLLNRNNESVELYSTIFQQLQTFTIMWLILVNTSCNLHLFYLNCAAVTHFLSVLTDVKKKLCYYAYIAGALL